MLPDDPPDRALAGQPGGERLVGGLLRALERPEAVDAQPQELLDGTLLGPLDRAGGLLDHATETTHEWPG
ncbi:hypothetical protein GCM10010428_35860 [Actinosynnema pretiosum subsp. pretiosum]